MEENRKQPKIGKASMTKIALVVAIVAVSMIFISSNLSLGPNSQSQVGGTEDTIPGTNALRRGPAPVPLVDSHGPSFQLTQAKSLAGFEAASLPSELPAGLDLASVRIRTSADLESNLMTAFYTPRGAKADDTATFASIMQDGGIAIIYAHEPTSPSYNQDKWIQEFVDDAPDVRRIETINGNPAIAVTGNPDKDLTYQVFMYGDDMQINLVSLKFTDTELLQIASTIS